MSAPTAPELRNVPMKVFDALIVGAGPAGSAAAVHLARDGYSVLLLEKSRFPRDKVCGDLVSARALTFLAEIGCAEEILRHDFVPITHCDVYLDGELLINSELPRLPQYPDSGRTVPRLCLDEIIFRAAVTAGAKVQEECTVVGHRVGTEGVDVDAYVKGRRRRFRGRVIVGADGAASIVARHAGLEMRDSRYVQLAMRAYCHGLPVDDAMLFFAEQFFPGYAWFFPIRKDVANIGVGMVKDSAQRNGIQVRRFFDRFEQFVRERAEEYGASLEIERPAGWPIKTYGGAGRNYFERGLLVGDAGCFVDPISGEGIPLALHSAELAAATIRRAFAAGDFRSSSMADFERRCHECYDADLGISDLVVSAARNRRFAKLWMHCLRVIALTAVRDKDYALKIGGILAGLVPGRVGLSPDILVKSFMHGPAFWLRAFNAPQDASFPDLLRHFGELVGQDLGRLQSTDIGWLGEWATEIAGKQLRVFQALVRGGNRDAR